MKSNKFAPTAMAVAISTASMGVSAQDQVGMLEEVIVTGVPGATTVLESSVSVSSLSSEEYEKYAPRNTAEIFRNIPGIRIEPGAGEGNANIGVRGLPMPDGGGRYVQLQEDGLPVTLFGDINFGNTDGWMRNDASTKSVEAIRGGSASTLASNAPGAVINFLSKTGEEEGGSVAVSTGLDYDHIRTDFEYGGPITETTRFHVGGFVRHGEGPRDAGMVAHEGGQLRANLTKEFDSGFVRLYYKNLDDRGGNYYPHPIQINGDDINGFDAGSDVNQSAFMPTTRHLRPDGTILTRDQREGQHSIVEAWGAEFDFDLGEGWSINNKFRTSVISGIYTGPFTTKVGRENDVRTGDPDFPDFQTIADEFGGTGSSLRYVNGPLAGQEFDDANGILVARQYVFDVDTQDMGSTVNDLRITKEFSESFTLTVGLFKGVQNIDQEWQWSTYITEARGEDAALLDVVDADGNVVTENGLAQYGVGWGLARDWDMQFDVTAPYIALEGTTGDFSWEVSVRQEAGNGNGVAYGNFADADGPIFTPTDLNNDGVITGLEQTVHRVDYSNPTFINWDYSETAWSAGGNYLITEELAAFARVSKGWRANADRQAFNADSAGNLPDDQLLDEVDQWELGVKWNLDSVDLFATIFSAETSLDTVDFTQTPSTISIEYEATGIEFEFDWSVTDSVGLNGSVTWTDAEIVSDRATPANNGNTPRRQPDAIYNFTVDWENDVLNIGANIAGQTSMFPDNDNNPTREVDGWTTVTLFGNWYITEAFSLSLNVNNVFDETAITASDTGWGLDETLGTRMATVLNGRTTSLTAKFSF